MKLEITNITGKYSDEFSLSTIREIIVKRLNDLKVKHNIAYGDGLLMVNSHEVKGHYKLFSSSVTNKIPLKETSPKYTKEKPFLNSYRLTDKQYKGVQQTFNDVFDNFGLMCDILLEEDDNTVHTIRKGNTKFEWPKPTTSLPVEM